jgi:hypothetical protein
MRTEIKCHLKLWRSVLDHFLRAIRRVKAFTNQSKCSNFYLRFGPKEEVIDIY